MAVLGLAEALVEVLGCYPPSVYLRGLQGQIEGFQLAHLHSFLNFWKQETLVWALLAHH